MLVVLDKNDLKALVNGVNVPFSVFENKLVASYGTYSGSYGTWSWKSGILDKLTENELLELYNICKRGN